MAIMYLIDAFPGESLMIAAIESAVAQNREACRIQDQRAVCWLYREEIDRQLDDEPEPEYNGPAHPESGRGTL